MGAGLLRAGRGAEAEDLFRRVLAGQRAGYGHDHPLVLGVLIQVSRAQYAQGKRVEAAESAHEVAEQRAAILGEDHPETVAARPGTPRSVDPEHGEDRGGSVRRRGFRP